MCKLSIIVPVYNVEPYIRRCVDSILSQTYQDFEAILVDDGSPDNCGLIIDEYAQKDSRIVPIHQLNGGVSAARNAGLKAAKGTYVGFVDPDDWIEPDMYSVLIETIELYNCDIVSCSWIDDVDGCKDNVYQSKLSSQMMTGVEYMKHLFDIPPTIYGSVWSKLFIKANIKAGFVQEYSICEDNLFVTEYCANCKKAVHIDRPLYHLYLREDSATRKNTGKVALGLPVRKKIIEVAKRVDGECGMLAERVFLDQSVAYSIKTIDEQYRNIAIKTFVDYMKKNSISVLRNKSIPFKEKTMYLYHLIKLAKGLE